MARSARTLRRSQALVPISDARPKWAYGALALWALLGMGAAGLAVTVVKAKMSQRLRAELERGFIQPGAGPGQIGHSQAAVVRPDGIVVHLSKDAVGYRLASFGPDRRLITERAVDPSLDPVGLGLAAGQLWVGLGNGKIALVDKDLRIGPGQETGVRTWLRFSGLPDGRLAGIEAGAGAVLVLTPGGVATEPFAGERFNAIGLEGGPGGLAAVGLGRDKAVQVRILRPDGSLGGFDAALLRPSPYLYVAWAGPSTLVLNDSSGPLGILAYDAASGRYLGSAQQSRQNDHLFNTGFVAGDPAGGGFLIRPALGLTYARLPLPSPGPWSLFSLSEAR